MAKGEITKTCAKCGKRFTRAKDFFKRADATRWEIWAESNINLCEDCSKAIAAEKTLREALVFAKEINLPVLEGSDKQVAWAEKIRYTVLKDFDPEVRELLRKSIIGFEESDVNMDALNAAGITLEELSRQYRNEFDRQALMLSSTSAKEIIDNR